MYSNTIPCLRTKTTRTKSPTTKGGMRISSPSICGFDRVDPIGDMRIGSHGLRHGRVRRIAQEFDMLRVIARARDPAAALLDPVLVRLRLRRREADMVKDEH